MNAAGFHPHKPRAYGSTAYVVTKAVSCSRSVADVAHKLGKGRTSITNATDPNLKPRLTLNDARAWARQDNEAARVFAEDFAALAGGHFDGGNVPTETPAELAGAAACECAEMVKAIFRLVESVKGDAKANAIKETEDVITLAVALRNRLLMITD